MDLRPRNKKNIEFSAASMTDLIFLLLIFFVVISTLVSPYGLNVLLPQSSNKNTGPKNITITITKQKEFFINGNQVDIADIEQQMSAKLKRIKDPGVILKADEMVPLGFVVKIMDIAKRNHYKLVIATKP